MTTIRDYESADWPEVERYQYGVDVRTSSTCLKSTGRLGHEELHFNVRARECTWSGGGPIAEPIYRPFYRIRMAIKY